MEELEVGDPWTLTKCNSMDPEGEMNHQPDGEKAAVEEDENWRKLEEDEMEVEMEVNAGVPQAERAGMKSPMIRAMLSTSPEEAEELAFVPSALSELRGATYLCDNHCSEKSCQILAVLRRWSLKKVESVSSAVTSEGCSRVSRG